MRKYAEDFAEKYAAGLLDAPGRSAGLSAALYPALYVFAGECEDAYAHIYKAARDMRGGAAFFLELAEDDPSRAIRGVKAEIQRNEAGLNIQRVNIYTVARAAGPDAGLIERYGRLLREIFEEDFPIVQTELVILLSESNHWEDYERRTAKSYQFLREAERFQRKDGGAGPVFSLVYLLSDRNENGRVSGAVTENNYRLVANLPALNETESRFKDQVYKLDEKVIRFATAGFAQLEKPNRAIAYAVFRHVYDFFLEALKARGTCNGFAYAPCLPQGGNISGELLSAATRDVKARRLNGLTLREAERELYGDGLERFFTQRYGNEYGANADGMIEAALTEVRKSGPYAPRSETDTARAEDLKNTVAQYDQKIKALYESVCRVSVFQSADAVKRQIAEVYALRYEREGFNASLQSTLRLEERLAAHFAECERLTAQLERASKELAQGGEDIRRVDVYYKQAVAGIFAELTARYGRGFISGEGFIEPAEVFWRKDEPPGDERLGPLAEKIAAFARKYILSHASVQLSFDEDLQKRSVTPLDEYDGEYPTAEEFYRQTLAEADKQAALSISLLRYDGLIREKFYFCDGEGVMKNYTRQLSPGFANEDLYFINEPSGFKIIRLAGGFTVDDMTRSRVMRKAGDSVD
ncbi:MAG: hypothetical protein LBR83_01550 [Clostridiales bacterium]|nr:hypothetical protein [Clostridiales bacterium]